MHTTATDDSLLTAKQAAEKISISLRKLWELTKNGEITAVRIGTAVRYSPADLADFVARCRVGK